MTETYKETKKLMLLHINSPDVQARVKNELLNLNFNLFASREGLESKALSALASHISNRAPKCPPSYRHESHRNQSEADRGQTADELFNVILDEQGF